MAKRNVLRLLIDLVFPPACRACGERLTVFKCKEPSVLCPTCMKLWQEQKQEGCCECGKAHGDCRCMPEALQQVETEVLYHLAEYRPDRKNVASKLVLWCKDHNDRDVFRFLAEQLSEPLLASLSNAEDSLRTITVTYVPRRRAAVRATGHDHAKQIAHMLSHELTLPYETLIRRKPLAKQQKDLGAAEREKNAASSFEMAASATVKGKTVILIDDVCTTGASLSTCVRLLSEAGAARIICAVVARTGKEKKSKNNA